MHNLNFTYNKIFTQEECDKYLAFFTSTYAEVLKQNKRKSFTYGTTTRIAQNWDIYPEFAEIRERVSSFLGTTFTIMVLQIYPNGKSGIKPHKDKEIAADSAIAGVSFGAVRSLVLQNSRASFAKDLENGSIYVLHPPTNTYWSHSIATDASIVTPRFSLTFR